MKISISCIQSTILKFFLVFLFIIGSTTAWSKCNKKLSYGWEEWEPFNIGQHEGLDTEILRAIVITAGCTFSPSKKPIPWKRHLAMLKSGKIDLATAASWTAERAAWAYFTIPYRAEYLGFFIRKGEENRFPKTPEDLVGSDLKLGTTLGATYGPRMDPILKKMGKNVQWLGGMGSSRQPKKLLKKRFDGYLAYYPDEPIFLKRNNFTDRIIPLDRMLINTGDIHIMLSKKANSVEVFESLKAAIVKLKKDGTLNKIFQKYSKKYGVSKW